MPPATTARLLVACPDQPGIIAAVTAFVAEHGGNVIDLQQHTDHTDEAFFLRVEFELDQLRPGPGRDRRRLRPRGRPVRHALGARVLRPPAPPGRCSRRAKRTACTTCCTAGGRASWRSTSRCWSATTPTTPTRPSGSASSYHHLPIVDGDKAAQERQVREAASTGARRRPGGARPLHADPVGRVLRASGRSGSSTSTTRSSRRSRAPARTTRPTTAGVKLDRRDRPLRHRGAGRRADHRPGRHPGQHRDDVDDLRRKGRDLEVAVLARAVLAHIDHRTLVYGRRTVVFE